MSINNWCFSREKHTRCSALSFYLEKLKYFLFLSADTFIKSPSESYPDTDKSK